MDGGGDGGGGDKGEIFRVAPDGKSEILYASDEAHIRVLAFDAKGNVIAGTEPSGRILRVSRLGAKTSRKDAKDANAPAAEGFVLYETSKREVTSLAVAPDGAIYAAATGDKPRDVSTPTTTTVITNAHGTTT